MTNVEETDGAADGHEHDSHVDMSNEASAGTDGATDDEALGTQGMIPGRRLRRTSFERISMRVLATGGIIGLDVALGAILGANHVQGWIDGLAIGLVSVLLAAVLWSSRQL
ncbi:MAG: hypothetical protein ABI298_03000 [Acidimicrobiales bacterium]